MDSKLIYIVASKTMSNVQWLKITDSEWIYFGAGDEVNMKIVIAAIHKHFVESKLYVVHNRAGSFEIEKKELINSITNLLGVENFSIWNLAFKKVIEFNRIGVLRCGETGS